MKRTQEQFDKAQEHFSKRSLSSAQKQEMLSSIYSKPIETNRPVLSPFMILLKKKSVALALIFIFIISGTTYASAQSLPGDLLYGLKVDVIEPVVLSLKIGKESKNEYKAYLLEKRIEEVRKLQTRDNLNENAQNKSHDAVQKNILDLRNSAIFNLEGENLELNEKIENYNSIIDDNLKIQIKPIIEISGNDIKEINQKLDENIKNLKERTDIEINTDIKIETNNQVNVEENNNFLKDSSEYIITDKVNNLGL